MIINLGIGNTLSGIFGGNSKDEIDSNAETNKTDTNSTMTANNTETEVNMLILIQLFFLLI